MSDVVDKARRLGMLEVAFEAECSKIESLRSQNNSTFTDDVKYEIGMSLLDNPNDDYRTTIQHVAIKLRCEPRDIEEGYEGCKIYYEETRGVTDAIHRTLRKNDYYFPQRKKMLNLGCPRGSFLSRISHRP